MLKHAVLILCFSLGVICGNASCAAQEKNAKAAKPASAQSSPEAAQPEAGFPVLFDDTEIFRVTDSPIASLSPENRAQIIRKNIQAFADSPAEISTLKVISGKDGSGIGNDDRMLLLITRQDAKSAGIPEAELANKILERIRIATAHYRAYHNWQVYGLGAAFTILSIIVLWQILRWNNRIFLWLAKKNAGMKSRWKNGIRFKELQVLSTGQIEKLILVSLKFLRALVFLMSFYFFLPLILSFFPETRKLSSTIFEFLLAPFISIFHTIIEYIPNLFYIAVIIFISYHVLKLISYIFNLIERGELEFEWFYADWAKPTYQIVRFLVIVTALISAYPYIPGSSSEAFQGVGLVLGAIISFASSSAISNIVAGIILTYTRAFKLYDRVKVGETTGDVVEKTLLVTRIMTIKHVVVTIPNSLVMSSQIINFSTSAEESDGVILHTSVTIGYDVPWQQVQKLLIEAALSTESVLTQPPPFVLQTSLDDFYVKYEINVYSKEPEKMALIYSSLHKNILDKFNDAGVEIMSPHYYAMRDGNATTVPSVLNTDGYVPPAFQLNK